MTLICAQPCTSYFAWQIEVMLTNFQEKGLDKYDIRCLFAFNPKENDWEEKVDTIKKVEYKFKKIATFYYYEDTRTFPLSYISTVRPHIIKKHFREYPKLSNRRIFYHDCDIVFTKTPYFLDFIKEDDDNWYLSNTIEYISSKYILEKGQDIFLKMCDIVGIHPNLVNSKHEQSGGAQYLMKGTDYWFWDKVERDSENMFREITELNKVKKEEDPKHDFQIWCADMWAVLWNAWMRGYNTPVIKNLDFTWAPDKVEKWDSNYIFHNAGVEKNSSDKHFYKAAFINSYPFLLEKEYPKEYASYKYFEIIKSIGNKSCLL